MGDIDEIGVDTAEGKDYASIVFLHGKEVKWDKPIDTLFIKPAMEEEMKRYARLVLAEQLDDLRAEFEQL